MIGEEVNEINLQELEQFKWMILKIEMLPLMMQEADNLIEKYISNLFI